MSPNGISSGYEKIFIIISSDSSDSESLLQEDIKVNGSEINKQWEAIERTLYQEPGQKVKDAELLKECRLWRDTFPHFRVKGTKIDVKQTGNELEETDRGIQTLSKHFNLTKLEEKRENIKTKVVGMLVERLISKYGPEKESANPGGDVNGGVQIAEIEDNTSDKVQSPDNNLNKNSETPTVGAGSESYFERGKPNESMIHFVRQQEDEDDLEEILNSWESDSKTAKKLPKSYRRSDIKTLETQKQDFLMKHENERVNKEPPKPKKSPPPAKTLIKPFEMTKKIDKKYDSLVDKIFERRSNDLDAIRHCRTSASGLDMRNFEESLEKLRIGSAFDEYVKRTAKLRIDKFDNNWLKRSDANFSYTEDTFPGKKTPKPPSIKPDKPSKLYGQLKPEDIDDQFIENLRKEMALNYKRPPKRSGVIEEINLRRPKPFRPAVEKTPKSLSCGDLQRKNKKETKLRQLKSGLEIAKKDPNCKKPLCHLQNNRNKGIKSNTNQNSLLPPIESGIICTELTGRPRIGGRIPPKRF